jgi:nitroreductase
MQIKDFIRKRKSTRKYDMSPLDKKILEKIEAFARHSVPLFKEIHTEYKIVEHKDIKARFNVKAPHYICIYSDSSKEGYLTNAGFLFFQLDLYISSLGLGSCWLGYGKPKEKETKEQLDYVIMIGFGKSLGSPYRELGEFKRKLITEICDTGDIKLEPARLAPSAVNRLPWYFAKDGGGYHVYCAKQGAVMNLLLGGLNKVDTGIALAALFVEYSDTFQFSIEQTYPSREGYIYLGRVTI